VKAGYEPLDELMGEELKTSVLLDIVKVNLHGACKFG
jgi:microcystin degradation protein MlrC